MLRSLEEAEVVVAASGTMGTPPSTQYEYIANAWFIIRLTGATSASHLAVLSVRQTAVQSPTKVL